MVIYLLGCSFHFWSSQSLCDKYNNKQIMKNLTYMTYRASFIMKVKFVSKVKVELCGLFPNKKNQHTLSSAVVYIFIYLFIFCSAGFVFICENVSFYYSPFGYDSAVSQASYTSSHHLSMEIIKLYISFRLSGFFLRCFFFFCYRHSVKFICIVLFNHLNV